MSQVNVVPVTTPMSLGQLVEHLVNFTGGPDEFLVHLLSVQCRAGGAVGGAVLAAGKDGVELLAVAPALPKGQPVPEWVRQAGEPAKQVLATGRPAATAVAGDDELYGQSLRHVIAIPLRSGTTVRGVTAFLIHGDAEILPQVCERLELSSSLFSLYDMRLQLQSREGDVHRLAGALETLDQFNGQRRAMGAAMAMCNYLAAARQASRVTLGLRHGRFIRAKAMSHTEKFTRQMKVVQDIESAMEECLDQDAEVIYPSPAESGLVTRAVEALSQHHGPSAICVLPLRQDGQVVGSLLIERASTMPFSVQEVEMLRLTCDLATPRLLDLFEHDRWVGGLLAGKTRKGLAHLLGPEDTWIKATVLGVVALVIFMIFAKGTYRVEAPFVVDAVTRQSVAMPFDDVLESVAVEPGDKLKAGQVMATLDTEELKGQIRSLEAEKNRFLTEAAVARRDSKESDAQIAEAQAGGLAAHIGLLKYQIDQATIKAPFDCVVVSGDLKHEIMSKKRVGDVLFEVAELDALRADLMVPESDVMDIVPQTPGKPDSGSRGDLATAADPSGYVGFHVKRINPMAEVVGKRNVFRVRVELDDASTGLKLGMLGVGKIDLGKRRYIWIWTHDMVEWVRMKLWV